jgi:phage terminase small subunit
MKTLTARQQTFVREFMLDLNATQAAIRAGYSQASAYSQGQRLLKNVEIEAAIRDARATAQERSEVMLDDILRELKRIAFTGLSKFIRINDAGEPVLDLSRCTPEDIDLLADLQVDDNGKVRRIRIKQLDKLKALETLGKHLGLYDRTNAQPTDRLAQALIEISQRGSVAPITLRSQINDVEDGD